MYKQEYTPAKRGFHEHMGDASACVFVGGLCSEMGVGGNIPFVIGAVALLCKQATTRVASHATPTCPPAAQPGARTTI
jgi:hypothetical protein|eukprot:COSAG01_NODE_19096_length_1031_cov_0.973176_2_plen_78_part_00